MAKWTEGPDEASEVALEHRPDEPGKNRVTLPRASVNSEQTSGDFAPIMIGRSSILWSWEKHLLNCGRQSSSRCTIFLSFPEGDRLITVPLKKCFSDPVSWTIGQVRLATQVNALFGTVPDIAQ
jgi:hypothetical protein